MKEVQRLGKKGEKETEEELKREEGRERGTERGRECYTPRTKRVREREIK